jgi:hypothetical protein
VQRIKLASGALRRLNVVSENLMTQAASEYPITKVSNGYGDGVKTITDMQVFEGESLQRPSFGENVSYPLVKARQAVPLETTLPPYY